MFEWLTGQDTLRSVMLRRFVEISRQLQDLTRGTDMMAKALEDLRAEVAENNSVIASAIALINGLSEKLKEAASADDIAAVEALAADLDKQNSALASAVAANTPAAPVPPQP